MRRQNVWTQILTNRMSVLIWVQTVWNSDSVPARIFEKVNILKRSEDNRCVKNVKNYPACKELIKLEDLKRSPDIGSPDLYNVKLGQGQPRLII